MVAGKATTSTSSRASSSRLPPAPMTPGTSSRFLLVATRAPDRRMQSHSKYAYYKPSPWTSSKTSSPRSARSGRPSAIALAKAPTPGDLPVQARPGAKMATNLKTASVNLIVPRGLLVAADEAIERELPRLGDATAATPPRDDFLVGGKLAYMREG